MKKGIKLFEILSASTALAFGGMFIINNEVSTNTSVLSQQVVKAADLTLAVKQGYTKSNVLKANTGKLTNSEKNALIKGSMAGMKDNNYTDTDPADNRQVDVTNLSNADKTELSKFALSLINSARKQMGKKAWTYSSSALRFADQVAAEYTKDGASCWDANHDVDGIQRAAKKCGLNYKAGQVYEDEAGLPITSNANGNVRSMATLKEQIYFNVKQMLFGGFAGTDAEMNDASRYFEWEHAGDLLGLRSNKGYDPATKYFGMSFSSLDNGRISVHMIGVASRYILNYKTFNK